jgi:hypothetical protein
VSTAYLRMLSNEDSERVHAASLEILERIGMLIEHEEARDALEAAGAVVARETTWCAYPVLWSRRSSRPCPSGSSTTGASLSSTSSASPDDVVKELDAILKRADKELTAT